MGGRKFICAYFSYLESMEPLNDAERGRLFTALLEYGKTGQTPELTGNERFIFPTMKAQIDRDSEKYMHKCEKQRQNATKRWDAMACDGMPRDAKDAKEKEKDKEKKKNKEKDKDKEKNISAPKAPERPQKHKYGEYNNVLLSDEDMEKLRAEFPTDWNTRIERLSSYMASTGKVYKNHLATIRNWARRDAEERKAKAAPQDRLSWIDNVVADEKGKGGDIFDI